jgi:hypothetical protein
MPQIASRRVPSGAHLQNLTTVMGSFHGRVLAARLGAEGVVVVLKGVSDGPYPLQGAVEVLVPAEQLSLAREILLADEVEDAFVDPTSWQAAPPPPGEPARRRPRVHGAPAALVVVVVITLIIVAFVAAAH